MKLPLVDVTPQPATGRGAEELPAPVQREPIGLLLGRTGVASTSGADRAAPSGPVSAGSPSVHFPAGISSPAVENGRGGRPARGDSHGIGQRILPVIAFIGALLWFVALNVAGLMSEEDAP